MNQLNEFIQQMRSLFAGMTPQSKLMAILLTVGIGVSTVFLIQGAATGNGTMVYLLDKKTLNEEELSKIQFESSVFNPSVHRGGCYQGTDCGLKTADCQTHKVILLSCFADLMMASTTRMSRSPSSPGTSTDELLRMESASSSICLISRS